jgi:hypothetical protein
MSSSKLPKHKKQKIKYKGLKIPKQWIAIGIIVLIVSFFINIWPIIFLSLFCVANAILLSIDRYVSAPVDFEFSTFSAILMTQAYSLKWGIAVAVLTKLAAIVYNKKFAIDHLFMIGGYIVAALMASALPGNILTVGLIATLVVNLYVVFVSKFITMLSNYEIVMYGSTNLLFNMILFIGFGDFIFKLMQFL